MKISLPSERQARMYVRLRKVGFKPRIADSLMRNRGLATAVLKNAASIKRKRN